MKNHTDILADPWKAQNPLILSTAMWNHFINEITDRHLAMSHPRPPRVTIHHWYWQFVEVSANGPTMLSFGPRCQELATQFLELHSCSFNLVWWLPVIQMFRRDAETLIGPDSLLIAEWEQRLTATAYQMAQMMPQRIDYPPAPRPIALEQAITNQEIQAFYQPIWHFKSGQFIAVEALMRWCPPDGPCRIPAEFLAESKRHGLFDALEQQVRHTVIGGALGLLNHYPELKISLNVTHNDLTHPAHIQQWGESLSQYHLSPQTITLEIQENLTWHPGYTDAAQLWKHTGFSLSLDDYGTGQNGLLMMMHIPFDVLKLDRAVVQGMTSPRGFMLIENLVRAIHNIGGMVVAEGVETADQMARCRQAQVDAVQGYFIAKPQPLSAIITLMREFRLA